MALFAFILVATVVASSMLVGAQLFRVRARAATRLQRTTYECGEAASTPTWIRFHARYYLTALLFVLFDIEAAFLLPWSVAVRQLGPQGLVAVGSFVAILMLGWVWAVRKGALEWQ
jgi:NADH:ubiquinone oxidoreductase subunit 3 (subunit A)